MRLITGLSLIALFAFFCSCDAKRVFDADDRYREDLNKFSADLVNFFPDTLSSVFLTQQSVDITNECIYFINYDFDKGDESLLQNIIEKAKYKYNSLDSNLFAIKRNKVYQQRSIFEEKGKDLLLEKGYFPVPFFEMKDLSLFDLKSEDIYSRESVCGLSDGFSIYIIDTEPGMYWEGLSPLKRMPKGWQNGYSRGICINQERKITIYWIIIW